MFTISQVMWKAFCTSPLINPRCSEVGSRRHPRFAGEVAEVWFVSAAQGAKGGLVAAEPTFPARPHRPSLQLALGLQHGGPQGSESI